MTQKKKKSISKKVVLHLAKLAALSLSKKQLKNIPEALSSVINYMANIKSLSTIGVEETTQVTNEKNIFREDIIDDDRMLTQEEALSNAKSTHNGYFKIKSIFNSKD